MALPNAAYSHNSSFLILAFFDIVIEVSINLKAVVRKMCEPL